MITRRRYIGLTLGAGAALQLRTLRLRADEPAQLIERAVPSTGEKLPVVGLGGSASFREIAKADDGGALKEVLRTLVEGGGKLFDTAPSYGASEGVAGALASELGITGKIFWATKVNVAGRDGGKADPAAARAQIEDSFRKIGVKKMDLIQVHNLGDVPVQLGILKELKKEGRVRYIGVTTTNPRQYAELEQVMRAEPLDFIGVDYAIDNRDVEATILPLAQERKIGVLVYVPFSRTSLFKRVGDQRLPAWAADFDVTTWAQFFMKYVISHPAVTVVTPATSQARHMSDNLGGGIGRLPNAAQRTRMIEFIDALPVV